MAKRGSKLALLDTPTESPRSNDSPEPTPTPEAQAITAEIDSRNNPNQHNIVTQLGVLSLLDTGMTERVVSEHTGIPKTTVNAIKHDEHLRYLLRGRVDQVKKSLPALLYEIATLGISSITIEEIKKLNPLQRMTMAAIGIDKARLLEGLSTENIGIVPLVKRITDELEAAKVQHAQLVELVNKGNGAYEAAT